MTDTPNRPPLWEVMDNGMDAQANKEVGQTDPLIWRRIRAAEIRALRDWLVSEETEPTGMRPCGDTYSAQSIKRGERQRLRALLTEQAEIAERGDG